MVRARTIFQRNAVASLGLLAFVTSASVGLAAPPQWWSQRSVVTPGATADDYAMANVGQLKRMAKAVVEHLRLAVPGGAGSVLEGLLAQWDALPQEERDDFAALNQGQLKSVGAKIYLRLGETDFSANPPWTVATDDDDNYAAANIGMLKNVFSFTLPSDVDSDEDGLPDWWEQSRFGTLAYHGWADTDGDGHLNREEFDQASNPNDDSDHSGSPDDQDGDGLILADEQSLHRDPAFKDHPSVVLQATAWSFP